MEYLYILQQALVWIFTIFWLYQLAISICSLVKLKDKPLLVEKIIVLWQLFQHITKKML